MCPDHRQHRGPHPDDVRLFTPEKCAVLRTATDDLCWLLSRGYALPSSLKLVGDRYQLQERQRTAMARAACSDTARQQRAERLLPWNSIAGEDLAIDGFNLLITIEAALGGGLLLDCRDGCVRDLASMHGSYKSVQETDVALMQIGTALHTSEMSPRSVLWLLDSPVSNSGRLAQRLREMAESEGWPWEVETVFNPDAVLRISPKLVISSDSVILDGNIRWLNAAAHLVSQMPDLFRIEI